MATIERLIMEMAAFDRGDARRIQHFIKVHAFARLIGIQEGLERETLAVLEAAAVVHDIAILPCEKKYGRCDGKLQEKEGPALARTMLERLGFDGQTTARVVNLVGRHHTYEGIDGIDCQILIEADFLVNLYEDNAPPSAVYGALKRIFRTPAGIRLCRDLFSLD